MTKNRLWVIAGVLGASTIAAVPAINAQAGNYPPDKHLKVTVTATGNPHEYIVSAVNAGKGCTFRVVSGKVKVNTPVVDGKATVTIDIGSKTGTRVILAKTISCKHKETTTTKVTTTTNILRGDTSATNGEKITIKALGWSPDSPVTISIVDGASHVVRSRTLTPNSSGNVFWKLTTPHSGQYAVVATQQGAPTKSYQLTIKPKKKHHH